MIAFIDDHRGTYGLERQSRSRPICRVRPIAPSTCHARVAQRADPALGSAGSQRDGMLRAELRRVHAENFGVYGVWTVSRQLGREGTPVARRTMARLMRQMGLKGMVRGKETSTTMPDTGAPCPADRVNRQFPAPRPNLLWASGFTCVAAWQGFVDVAFVIDTSARRIVGWRVSRTAHAGVVLAALAQALHDRRPLQGIGLVNHSDRDVP